jgi:hypothetical protein
MFNQGDRVSKKGRTGVIQWASEHYCRILYDDGKLASVDADTLILLPALKATIGQIIESWIDLANQAMRHEDDTLRHGFTSANEDAIELLGSLGLVAEVEPEVWRWVEPSPDLAEIAKLVGR